VTFTRKPRSFGVPRSRLRLVGLPLGSFVRLVLLAALVVVAAAWAFERHYSRILPPMRKSVAPAAAPAYDGDAGEIPVPEIIEPDA
jgi:hypothetical protein